MECCSQGPSAIVGKTKYNMEERVPNYTFTLLFGQISKDCTNCIRVEVLQFCGVTRLLLLKDMDIRPYMTINVSIRIPQGQRISNPLQVSKTS